MLTRNDIKNTVSLVGAEGIGRGLAFVLTVFIARELGVSDFGLYSTAVSFVFLFSVFIEIGLSTYIYRESSKKLSDTTKYIFSALIVQSFLSIIVGIVVVAMANLINYPSETKIVIYLLWLWMIGISLGRMIRIAFKAHQRMELDALVNIFENGSRFILVLGALRLGLGVVGIASASIISSILMLAASTLLAVKGKFLHFAKAQWNTNFTLNLLKAAFPFTLSLIATIMMYRISTVILSVVKGDYEVGIFDASFKISSALFFLPVMVCQVFFPKLSHYYATNDFEQFSKTVMLLGRYIYLMFYPLLMIIFVFAPQLIGIVYTAEFSPTIPILQILMWLNLFNAGTYVCVYALNAAGFEKSVMRTMFLGVIGKTVISVILIVQASYTGAAIGALISELFVTTLLFSQLLMKLNLPHLKSFLLKTGGITAVSFSAILLGTVQFNQWITLFLFVASFSIAIIISRFITLKDWQGLQRLVFQKAL